MPLNSDVATRVDQLAADLRKTYVEQASKATAPSSAPLFTVTHDGTVLDRAGKVIKKANEVRVREHA